MPFDAARQRWRIDKPARVAYLRRMEQDVTWDLQVDAIGLLCPLPVLRARKALQTIAPGQTLRLLATDPAAVVDVPHFCAEAGHVMVAATPCDDAMAYLIRKGATAPSVG